MTTTDRTRRDFTLTWTLDAPPPDVFRAWTDPAHLGWFYNPDNPVPTEPVELELRVGGVWRQMMIIDESTAYATGGIYLEIVPGERLVFAWGATDGWPKLDPERLEESPVVTVTLDRAGAGTQMTLHVELPEGISEEAVQEWLSLGIRNGWQDTVDRLAVELARVAS